MKKFFKRTNMHIFIFITIPCLLVVICSFFSLISFQNTYKNTLKDSYISSLKSLSKQQEDSLKNISNSIATLSDDKHFLKILNTEGDIEIEDFTYMQKVMKKVKENYPIIDSILVLNRVNARVYTQNTTYDANNYFTSLYRYENYDYNYWKKFYMAFSDSYALPPSMVFVDNGQKLITPIVYTKSGSKYIKNPIIVNVDLSYMFAAAEQQPIFDKSTLSIVNKTTKQNFSIDNACEILPEDLFSCISDIPQDGLNAFDYNAHGVKSFIVSYSPTYSILGYVYMITTPYSIIYDSIPRSINLLFWLNCTVFIIAILLSIKGTSSIYSPIKRIENLFSDAQISDKTSLDDLYGHVLDTLESNRKLSKALPLIKEQQLINILNSNEHYFSGNYPDTIEFSYPYFCSVIITLNPTKYFYEKYDTITEKNIELEIYNIISSEFLSYFPDTYIIPSAEHTLYILLNTDEKDNSDILNEIFKHLDLLFMNDTEDIRFAFAAGATYPGIEGLKQSHKEAIANRFKTSQYKRVRINIDNSQDSEDILFSYADEMALYNHLISYNIDDAKKIINRILNKNYDNNISDVKLVQLFHDLFGVIFKVFRTKKIDYDPEQKGDMLLIDEILSPGTSHAQTVINDYLKILQNFNEEKKLKPRAVISYIQNHFTENIYLETLAETFHTSPSYLSRVIKKETSSTFSDYLNVLRINEAKKLLLNTRKPIKEIYETVGYNNRNTFIRIFKSITGTTPSDYRANQK